MRDPPFVYGYAAPPKPHHSDDAGGAGSLDALGARDSKLTEILTKVGSVASKQSQSTTIVVAALPQDFAYLNQSIRRGIAPQRTNSIQLENLAVGSCQPNSVQVRPTE